jgi:hypothetical protein
MIGNGVAGVMVAVLRVITKLAFANTAEGRRTAAIIYFALAAVVMLICVVLFVWLTQLPITRFYHAQHRASQRHQPGALTSPPAPVRHHADARAARHALHSSGSLNATSIDACVVCNGSCCCCDVDWLLVCLFVYCFFFLLRTHL